MEDNKEGTNSSASSRDLFNIMLVVHLPID